MKPTISIVGAVTITKHGQSVCQLIPYYGALRGSIRITGDLIAPLDVVWEALP
jgi:hypothetical protein